VVLDDDLKDFTQLDQKGNEFNKQDENTMNDNASIGGSTDQCSVGTVIPASEDGDQELVSFDEDDIKDDNGEDDENDQNHSKFGESNDIHLNPTICMNDDSDSDVIIRSDDSDDDVIRSDSDESDPENNQDNDESNNENDFDTIHDSIFNQNSFTLSRYHHDMHEVDLADPFLDSNSQSSSSHSFNHLSQVSKGSRNSKNSKNSSNLQQFDHSLQREESLNQISKQYSNIISQASSPSTSFKSSSTANSNFSKKTGYTYKTNGSFKDSASFKEIASIHSGLYSVEVGVVDVVVVVSIVIFVR
jgi:hypothetical protein